jgi:hypothetical protein
VDKTSNNRIYIHFLGMLRDKYLARQDGLDFSFHSVILAGVYDIKNLKLKMINEGIYTPTAMEGSLRNSPWNIAADFKVDMSFNPGEIASMLNEYEQDHRTGMDIPALSALIHEYTDGYPYLVSDICKLIDEDFDGDWTAEGVQRAVRYIIYQQKSTLFDDIFKNLETDPRLYRYIYELLITGTEENKSADDPTVEWALMFGFVKQRGEKIGVGNRIFEIRISNYFISKESSELDPGKKITQVLKYDVAAAGKFDMELALRKFAEHFRRIYNRDDAGFLERQGRLLFLTYLTPLINGEGFYHFESQLTDRRRMDLVVNFGREEFIIELKIWHGESRHEAAYRQLAGYLRSRGASRGYLLTFDFRQEAVEESCPASQGYPALQGCPAPRGGERWVDYEGLRIFDVVL